MNLRIVIVGPSCSGKTTVARYVSGALGLPLVSMDGFRVSGRRYFVDVAGREVRTFEHPQLWNERRIGFALTEELDRGFVAEGNHLLRYPEIASIPNLQCFYLDLPWESVIARRRDRARMNAADESFILVGELETAKYVLPQKDHPGIRILDARKSAPDLMREIIGR